MATRKASPEAANNTRSPTRKRAKGKETPARGNRGGEKVLKKKTK